MPKDIREIIRSIHVYFNMIKNESKKTNKVRLIKEFSKSNDAKYFLLFLHMLYDDNFVCGIKRKKFDKAISSFYKMENRTIRCDCFTSAIESLYERESANEEEIIDFVAFLHQNDVTKSDIEFVRDVICKDYKCGIGDKIINEAYGKTIIDNFSPMKGKSYDPNKHLMNGEWFALTEKIDGLRAMIICDDNGGCKIISSSGKEIKGLEHLYINFQSIVLDGELYVDYMNDRIANFREVQSVVSSDSHPNKHLVKFKCFDMIEYCDLVNKHCHMSYIYRRKILEETLERINNKNIILIDWLYKGDNKNVIEEYKKLAIESGWEGIIINLLNAPYEFKRTKSILKVKDFKDAEFLVIDMYEGEGKNVGKLGGLVIIFDGNTVNVGGGFSDEQRELFWNKPETVLRKMITVNYMDEFIDASGNKSLRHPGFKGIREEGY